MKSELHGTLHSRHRLPMNSVTKARLGYLSLKFDSAIMYCSFAFMVKTIPGPSHIHVSSDRCTNTTFHYRSDTKYILCRWKWPILIWSDTLTDRLYTHKKYLLTLVAGLPVSLPYWWSRQYRQQQNKQTVVSMFCIHHMFYIYSAPTQWVYLFTVYHKDHWILVH